jgi:geranylgeranyl transferase type-2 subunit beta
MDAPQNKDDLTYHMTAHLRMNAVYWGLTALCIMKHKEALDAEETIEYVMSCWDDEAGAHESPNYNHLFSLPPTPARAPPHNSKVINIPKGAFGAHPGHDAHILSTLSAIQVLATHDALSRLNTSRVVDCPSLPVPSLPPHYIP